jgi:hypothetical protein
MSANAIAYGTRECSIAGQRRFDRVHRQLAEFFFRLIIVKTVYCFAGLVEGKLHEICDGLNLGLLAGS